MSHYLVRFARAYGVTIAPLRRRPAGVMFPFWTGSFRLLINHQTIQGVDNVFQQFVGRPIHYVGKDLQGVPILTRDR